MAESAVASVVRAFGTLAADEAAFLRGVHAQADLLRDELRRMQCFLRDADARRRGRGRDGALITNWVADVRAAAYDAGNALEGADFLARYGNHRFGLAGFLAWCADLAALHRLGVTIRRVRDRIREISAGAVAYGIADLGAGAADVEEQAATPCDVSWNAQDGDLVIGFHRERDSILQVLLDHDIGQICVVSVVGMAGSGKSTLAKKIYNDPRVEQHFHASSWILVSEKYRFLDLIKDIARRIMGITRKRTVEEEEDQDGEGTSSGAKMKVVRKLLTEFRSGGRKKVTIEELDRMGEEDVRELLRELRRDGRMKVTLAELDKMGEKDARELLREFRSDGKKEVTVEELDKMSEEDVRELLREFLADKKFLLVLDDVWKSNSYSEINRILSALPDANNGSRIILTTRDMNVAKHVEKRSSIHEKKLLDDRESWVLLEKRSFPEYQNVSMADRSRLMPIGKKLALKCKGLPLALVVLGGYLSRNLDYDIWSGLISNLDWETRKNDEPVWNIIARSYNDLPNRQLKDCFLYLASFPEDYVIRVARLCKLLIAEGIIPHRPNWTLEDTSREYIKELAQRSMLQIVGMSKWRSSIKSVVLHDVLREWGIAEARREGLFNIWSNPTDAEPFSDSIMAYRITLHNFVGRTEINVAMPKLRTLLVFFKLPAVSVLCRLKYLRVLDLYGLEYLKLLPSGIGNLIHLRFIGLQKCGNGLVCIPSSASHLLNLQTLDARGSEVRSLPQLFWNISTLRHLFFGRVKHWDPPEVGCLGSLQTLYFSDDSCVLISTDGALTSKHRRLIRDSNKHTVRNNQKKWAAFIRALKEMEQAVVLHLERWVNRTGPVFSIKKRCVNGPGVLPGELISSISHHRHLQVLELTGEMKHGVNQLSKLPHGLKKLKLTLSKLSGDPMPVLGMLPNLVVLALVDAVKWKSMICHAGGFPRLCNLTFVDITTVESWNVEAGAFPSLTHLNLISSFTGMPLPPPGLLHMTSLQTLLVKQSPWDRRPVSLENVAKLKENGCEVVIR